jgi:uncharacterized protein YdaU (DUF1376 family)
MAPQKSPAFSFYAKDFLTGTSTMSLQEVGAYIRLLAYSWDAGSVPTDPGERARLLGCAKSQERELWNKVGKKFMMRGDVYVNERIEEERSKQARRRQTLSDNGKQGGRPQKANENQDESKSFSETKANENQKKSLPSSSSFSSSKPDSSKNDESGAARAQGSLIASGESVKFDRKHGQHLVGFCDWCCFPMELVDRFAKRIPGDDDGLKRAQIKQWAEQIRTQWSEKIVPDGSDFDFWTNRWTETHGGSRPANATLKAARASADIDEAFR